MSKLALYEAQIQRLSENPEDIATSWFDSEGIFGFISSGCPTMFRSGFKKPTTELEIEISTDERIPRCIHDLQDEFVGLSVEERKEKLRPFLEYRMRQDELENLN